MKAIVKFGNYSREISVDYLEKFFLNHSPETSIKISKIEEKLAEEEKRVERLGFKDTFTEIEYEVTKEGRVYMQTALKWDKSRKSIYINMDYTGQVLVNYKYISIEIFRIDDINNINASKKTADAIEEFEGVISEAIEDMRKEILLSQLKEENLRLSRKVEDLLEKLEENGKI